MQKENSIFHNFDYGSREFPGFISQTQPTSETLYASLSENLRLKELRKSKSRMTNNWEEIKWIFEPDGTLRDIYVENVNIEDWKILIDYLNTNHIVKYGPSDDNQIINKINKDYLIQLLTDVTGKLELKTVAIIIDNIIINTHFFTVDEIEFDIEPEEINSVEDYEKVLSFMNEISRILNKQLILTGENQIQFPLVTVEFSKNLITALTKKDAEKLWK